MEVAGSLRHVTSGVTSATRQKSNARHLPVGRRIKRIELDKEEKYDKERHQKYSYDIRNFGKEKAALLCQEAASLYAVEPVSPFGDWPGARRDDAFLGCLAALIGGSRKGGSTLAFAFAETSDFRGLSF
ncbi:hypothetical protein TNIN_442041 [Trichonephila inaurata madagascariensis]|uniref:Uncharacterized protein n=1 Tax=Trichonephila inaurata madagascariensis TaxID=2747483 RepID=A0A8X7C245_9ARAC|nr:hypothetical protein TNIN_442041 [Trichonephila inaurata madagascariensis]